MGLLFGILEGILCGILYFRMCKREVPETLGKKAAIPAVLGLVAPLIYMLAFLGLGYLTMRLFGGEGAAASSNSSPSHLLSSLLSAFIIAGFPEELIKFLFILLSIKIVKPKNLYEYGLIAAGVGFGFTFLEEISYGGGNLITAVGRLPFFAMHMVFDIPMGLFLGLAKYDRQNGRSGAVKHTILALVIPVLWHTVFDSVTAFNAWLNSGVDEVQVLGVILAFVVIAISSVLQIVELVEFKKKTPELCAMEIA